MNFQDLLVRENIDPQYVLVLRHRPRESQLKRILPWLAAEDPEVFNAYQQTQTEQVERSMKRARHVAPFIGHEPGKALFVGLYSVEGYKKLTRKEYWEIEATQKLKEFGHYGFPEDETKTHILWFDLKLNDFYKEWKGKLIIRWPPLDKNWYRWAHKSNNYMPIHAILEESALSEAMPEWHEIKLSWRELKALPTQWKAKLSEWRGIYYLFDTSDGKGYVGSAYGENNLLGRWLNYATSGHGGNRLLKNRDPQNFFFTILQRVSPDMEAHEIIKLENSWKERLHTREPYGLNDN